MKKKIRNFQERIIHTIIICLVLCLLFFVMINYIYQNAEDEAFDKLHNQTLLIKENIQIQIKSDIENLSTMANFAAKLYADGEGFELLFNSFKPIGLIDNIGIYMPDGTFYIKSAKVNLGSKLNFQQEAQRGTYISGRVADITYQGRELVRCAVPVRVDGKVVAILYGAIELDRLNEKYAKLADAGETDLFILEQNSGEFIIDTCHDSLSTVTYMENCYHKKCFNDEKMRRDIIKGKNGFSSFKTDSSRGGFYFHYAPMGIENWQIVVSQPEDIAFAAVHKTRNMVLLIYAITIFVMALYIFIIFTAERKKTKLHFATTKIRKLLLGINNDPDCIVTTLKGITEFADARSAFFIDSHGTDYSYIIPDLKDELLTKDERQYFIKMIVAYAYEHRDENRIMYTASLGVGKYLKKSNLEFNKFLENNQINNVQFATIIDSKDHISMLGITNPKANDLAAALLKDISVCFSMAVYNKRYLEKTEISALTDPLTGIANRMAYKKDVEKFDMYFPSKFSCVYIDVNELHFYNNKYGHAAGDNMLLFISNTLREFFKDDYIYRIGGDEFLVFAEDTEKEEIISRLSCLNDKVEAMGYHISIGMEYNDKNLDTTAMVNAAEKKMYEEKAIHYQRKNSKVFSETGEYRVQHIITGMSDIDATLSVICKHYYGIYCVSLSEDSVRRIVMPSFFRHFISDDEKFSKTFSHYIRDMVTPEYHRSLFTFIDYDSLKHQISDGKLPNITYVKNGGERVALTIYPRSNQKEDTNETIWIFEKM